MENGLHGVVCRDVLNGNYPKDTVNKMNSCKLEALVLSLVKYTSTEAGTQSVSTLKYRKPQWWPADILFDKPFPEKNGEEKQFRLTLRQLILKCSEFFRNSSIKPKWPPNVRKSLVNDENFVGIKTRGIKRRNGVVGTLHDDVNNVKKRKTLISKNESVLKIKGTQPGICEPIVCLQDIFSTPKEKKPLTQEQFLNNFGLYHNNDILPTRSVSQIPRFIKLHNCPHIPFSSDVGQAIIQRENYNLADDVTARKLERLEWYINKQAPKKSEQEYVVSPSVRNVRCHFYRFPKRQYHQIKNNTHYQEFIFKLCRPLKVVLSNEDLELKKKQYDDLKVTVSVPRLSSDQLNKYLCKNIKIVLDEDVCRAKSRVVQRQIKPSNKHS